MENVSRVRTVLHACFTSRHHSIWTKTRGDARSAAREAASEAQRTSLETGAAPCERVIAGVNDQT